MAQITKRELRDYFDEWLKSAYEDGLLHFDTQQILQVALRENIPEMTGQLNDYGKANLALSKEVSLKIVLRIGSDPTGGPFNLFEIRWPGKPKYGKLRCFVGHRFSEAISSSLRTNLRHVLEPLSIQMDWAGMDLAAVGFFDNIIRLIQVCDFCIFDNRDAVERPNVYIEMGIAYTLKKPFIVADYQGNRIGLPSDLGHINTISYRDYRQLTRSLYFKLPRFLESTGLRQPV